MKGNGRRIIWAVVAGSSAIALGVLVSLTISKAILDPLNVQAAINPLPLRTAQSPAPLSSASEYWPLDAIAEAVTDQGKRGSYTDTFSALYLDVPRGRVVVCVTNLHRGHQMLQAAKRQHPSIDLHRVTLVPRRVPCAG